LKSQAGLDLHFGGLVASVSVIGASIGLFLCMQRLKENGIWASKKKMNRVWLEQPTGALHYLTMCLPLDLIAILSVGTQILVYKFFNVCYAEHTRYAREGMICRHRPLMDQFVLLSRTL
jgi:hypothetical protein